MSADPTPLPSGGVLAERFAIQRVLGRGGFGIAYLASDESRGDRVVVKELAPVGVRRAKDGLLDLDTSGTSGHILRHRFLQEAEILRRLNHSGIPALRAAFAENGTAYHVTSYIPGGRTLEERLRRDGRLSEDDAREIFTSLLDILEVVHAAGVLHRDIKPSNILLGPQGEVVLLDFGAARDWVAGGWMTHTVMHTPGYAPPEQLSERATRGPGTDLYALCATTYHTLAGKPPPTAPDRMADIPLLPLRTHRPELDAAFCAAIERGLAIRMADRPESVEAIRTLLRDDAPDAVEPSLHRIDEVLVRLRQFRFDRRACPACDGMLHEPRPLKRLGCPVCREGTIRPRNLDEGCCPVCRIGAVATIDNSNLPAFCPACSTGRLAYRRKSLLSAVKMGQCPSCSVNFEVEGEQFRGSNLDGSFAEARLLAGRGLHVKACDTCPAEFDELTDGRWRQTAPAKGSGETHYWDEWVRLAAGLSLGTGNAACDACSADYWREGDHLTLLDAVRDPFGFGQRFVGRSLPIDDITWLGVGKSSGEPGLVCDTCPTEFDRDGGLFRLVESPNRRIGRHVGEPRTIEDWHRIAQGLPPVDKQAEFEAELDPLLLEAYLIGEIAFDADGAVWRGRAKRLADGTEATLAIGPEEISFGGPFRRWRADFGSVVDAEVIEDTLSLFLVDEEEPHEFEVLPIMLTAHLRSGDRSIQLTASELAERLSRMFEPA